MEERLEMRGGGTLTLLQEGNRIQIQAERPLDGMGLYKVWLHGDHGGKFLLGTLTPEDGCLRLRRVVSIGTLERAGCWPRFWAEAPLAFSFHGQPNGKWYCEQHPDQLVSDSVLKGLLRSSMLCKKEEEGFSLAAPFRTDCPTPLNALFCLALVEYWDGRAHLVWQFDREGNPKVPHKTDCVGHTNG